MTTENQSKPTGSTAAAAPPAGTAAKTPAPAKPDKKDAEKPVDLRRRIIWACVWGYLGVNFLMFLRFFFPRVLFEPSTVFSIGYPTDFALGDDTKFQKDYRVVVVRNTERLFVIYLKCTHLGCTPDWKPSENKFKCPCHGSGYDSEGINFEGPAPRPMDRCHVELDATGRIIVDSSRLYVQDFKAGRNEFDDKGSFMSV